VSGANGDFQAQEACSACGRSDRVGEALAVGTGYNAVATEVMERGGLGACYPDLR
jgi:hypothetical protein